MKSAFSTTQLPTTWGTRIHADQVLPSDADLVVALEAAGGVVCGKTALTEYCSAAAPATLNPHDALRTPGGSSSGSAAAVAAGLVPLALGSQTLGSVVRPAAYCGVYGFKPTFGLVSRGGLQRVSESLDTVGWFTSTPEDALLVLLVATQFQNSLSRMDGHLQQGAPPGHGLRQQPSSGTGLAEPVKRQYPCQYAGRDVLPEFIVPHEQALHSGSTWAFLPNEPSTGTQPSQGSKCSAPSGKPLQGARVALICCEKCAAEASPEALAALESAAEELRRMGAHVIKVPLPPHLQAYFEEAQARLAGAN